MGSAELLTLFAKKLLTHQLSAWLSSDLSAFEVVHEVDGTVYSANARIMHLQVRWLLTSADNEVDVQEIGFCFVNNGGELPGSIPDDTALQAVEDAITAWWNSNKSDYSDQLTLSEYRWYAQPFDNTPSGPPHKRSTPNIAATHSPSASALPLETAMSVTFVTALRKHWGRVYLPMAISKMSTTAGTWGQISDTYADTIAGVIRGVFNTAVDNDLIPVIWSRSKQSVLSIAEIHVDTTPDHIRRRRPHKPHHKAILTSPS